MLWSTYIVLASMLILYLVAVLALIFYLSIKGNNDDYETKTDMIKLKSSKVEGELKKAA